MTGNNDNVIVSTRNPNDNVNDIGNKYDTSKNVERIAGALVEKFGNAAYFPFYCKVAYKLSEAQIWSFFEQANAKTVRNPAKLFSWLCDRAISSSHKQ